MPVYYFTPLRRYARWTDVDVEINGTTSYFTARPLATMPSIYTLSALLRNYQAPGGGELAVGLAWRKRA